MRIVTFGLGLLAFSLITIQSAAALVNVRIDLSTQRMRVESDSGAQFLWPVSSGRAGHLTPRGLFRPQRMMPMAYSIKYEMAPMPHAIFFTGGYAIHGTNAVGQLGRPASHGCVRLAPGNAAILYALVRQEGARISISGAEPGARIRSAGAWWAPQPAYAGRWLQHRSLTAYRPSPEPWPLRLWLGDAAGE